VTASTEEYLVANIAVVKTASMERSNNNTILLDFIIFVI
jgi:hypothetical protein